MNYYDYDDDTVLTCQKCGWQGIMKDADINLYDEYMNVRCPRVECDESLFSLPFPTTQETKQAARDGKNVAPVDLMTAELIERVALENAGKKLRYPSQLPDIDGIDLEFVWDRDEEPFPKQSYVLYCRGNIVWKQPSYYEDAEEIPLIVNIFKAKYGERFKEMAFTWAALFSLIGDKYRNWSYVTGCPIIEHDGSKNWEKTK